jgi:dTMP kinase
MKERRRRRGLLVVLEGVDGAGKSTLQRRLARRWRTAGFEVRCTREPVDREIGRFAQELGRQDPWNSALLFTVDRLLGRRRVERWLERRQVVLQDRSFYSTLAYQGSALRAEEGRRVRVLQDRLALAPDRVVLLEVPRPEATRRRRTRGARVAPLERDVVQRRVARAYGRLAREEGWLVLEASAPPEVLEAEADHALRPLLRRRLGPGRRRR